MYRKIIVFLSRLPKVDRAEFREYYETRHVPKVLALMPSIDEYERNYPDVSRLRPADGETLDDLVAFDAVTVLKFNSRESFDAYKAALRDPDVMRAIQEDEANFLDNTRTRMFVVEECVSELAPNPDEI